MQSLARYLPRSSVVKSDKCTAGLWEAEEGGEQSLASSGALILQGCQDDRWRMGTKEGKRSVQEGGKPEYTPKSHPKENPTRRPVAGGEGLGSSVYTPQVHQVLITEQSVAV